MAQLIRSRVIACELPLAGMMSASDDRSEPNLRLHAEVPCPASGKAFAAEIIVDRITIRSLSQFIHVTKKRISGRALISNTSPTLKSGGEGQLVEITAHRLILINVVIIAIAAPVRIEIHILPRGLIQQGEVRRRSLRYPQVKCRPVVAVAVAIAVFAVLGYHRRRQLPVFPSGRIPYDAKRRRPRSRSSRHRSPADALRRPARRRTAGRFPTPWRQAVELLFVVQGQHRVVAVLAVLSLRRGIAPGGRGIIFQVIVALGGHHPWSSAASCRKNGWR